MSISNFLNKKEIPDLNMDQKENSQKNISEILDIPKNIGPYEVQKKLKEGGYSKIYLAQSKYTGENVAIKSIEKISLPENFEDILLAKKQIEILKLLKHKNILTLYEIYESPTYIYLITEYLSGKDLVSRLITKKRFPEDEALIIFYQLIDALIYMHKMNICHRDIRTEHILFDKNNYPKLIGFAYSTFYSKDEKLKESFGSLCYVCPEILQNLSYDPELADVWSIGVVLYVMICGYLPFSEEDDEKNKECIIRGKIDFPKEMSNKVKDLLKHMLDVNPAKRYTFQKIVKHPWFKPYSEEALVGGCNIYKMIYPIDEKLLNIILIYGFKKKEIDIDMKQNKFNIGTGLYKQLIRKILDMGMKSISDLSCSEYKKFRDDKDNYFSDGEKKYQKYFKMVQAKIQSVEKIISDYQSKEENVIQQLTNIEENELKIQREEKAKEIAQNNNKNNNNNNINIDNNIICFNFGNNNPFARGTLTKKNTCHRRTLTPMFAIDDFDNQVNNNEINEVNIDIDNEKNKEIGHINKKELSIYKRRNTVNIKRGNNSKYNRKYSHEKKMVRSMSLPNIKNLIIKLLNKRNSQMKKSDEDNNNACSLSTIKWVETSMMICRRRKSYLNTSSSFIDSFLKKSHPENLKKNESKNNLINDINQIIIEEDIKNENLSSNKKTSANKNNNNINSTNNYCSNSNNQNTGSNKNINIINCSGGSCSVNNQTNNNNNLNINNGMRKSKHLRYSLSFGEDEDDEIESSYNISKIDSKHVSIMLDMDEDLKIIKEIRSNLKSPNIRSSKVSKESKENQTTLSEFAGSSNNRNNINLNGSDNKVNTDNNQNNNINLKNNEQSKKDNKKEIVFDNRLQLSFHKNKKNNYNENNIEEKQVSNFHCNKEIFSVADTNNSSHHNNKNGSSISRPETNSTNSGKSNKNKNEEIYSFKPDNKNVSKINIFNEFNNEDMMLGIHFIEKKKQSQYTYKYIKDISTIQKINIFNNDGNFTDSIPSINDIEKKRMQNIYKEKEKEYTNRNSPSPLMYLKTADNNKNCRTDRIKIQSIPFDNSNNYQINSKSNLVTKNINKNNSKNYLPKIDELFKVKISKGEKYNKIRKNEGNIENKTQKISFDFSNKNKEKDISTKSKFYQVDKLTNNTNKSLFNLKNSKNISSKSFIMSEKTKNKANSEYTKKSNEEFSITNITDVSDIKNFSILSPNINYNNERIKNLIENKENITYNDFLLKNNYMNTSNRNIELIDQNIQIKSFFRKKGDNIKNNNDLLIIHENDFLCPSSYNKIINGQKEANEYHYPKSSLQYYRNEESMVKHNLSLNNFFGNNSIQKNSEFYCYDNNISKEEVLDVHSLDNNNTITLKKKYWAEKLKNELIQKISNNNSINPSALSTGRMYCKTKINGNIIECTNENEYMDTSKDQFLCLNCNSLSNYNLNDQHMKEKLVNFSSNSFFDKDIDMTYSNNKTPLANQVTLGKISVNDKTNNNINNENNSNNNHPKNQKRKSAKYFNNITNNDKKVDKNETNGHKNLNTSMESRISIKEKNITNNKIKKNDTKNKFKKGTKSINANIEGGKSLDKINSKGKSKILKKMIDKKKSVIVYDSTKIIAKNRQSIIIHKIKSDENNNNIINSNINDDNIILLSHHKRSNKTKEKYPNNNSSIVKEKNNHSIKEKRKLQNRQSLKIFSNRIIHSGFLENSFNSAHNNDNRQIKNSQNLYQNNKRISISILNQNATNKNKKSSDDILEKRKEKRIYNCQNKGNATSLSIYNNTGRLKMKSASHEDKEKKITERKNININNIKMTRKNQTNKMSSSFCKRKNKDNISHCQKKLFS